MNDPTYSTSAVSEEEIADGIPDEYAVLYSKDGKRLLKCENKDIREYTVRGGTKVICDNAFYGCWGLKNAIIPNSVTEIGRMAFYQCAELKEVTIGNGVTKIGDWAFNGCTGLTKFEVAESNEYFCAVDGVLYSKDMTTLIQFPIASSITFYTIPNGVKTIGPDAFEGCTQLKKLTIPESVTTIGDSAFSGCIDLTEVAIYEGVTSISDFAFYGCTGLTNLTIPNSATEVGASAFSGCTGLTELTIPEGVTSIGDSAFSGSAGLTKVTIGNSVTEIGYNAFGRCKSLTKVISLNAKPPICGRFAFYNVPVDICTLYVPAGSAEAYSIADIWRNLTNIAEIN